MEIKGKIGIFDSGLGGLTILKEVVKFLPNHEYIYLGDNVNAPYGEKPQDEIFKLTLAGVEWLFKNECEIVVLACNTASAKALRKIQQEILPLKYPTKRVLGIIIPTIEEISEFSDSMHIGILATQATVDSGIYEEEAEKRSDPKIKIIAESGGDLVNLIEQNNTTALDAEIKRVTKNLLSKDTLIDTIVLACTHYALIKEDIQKAVPKNIKVVGQGALVAKKLLNYLQRHEEIRIKLSDKSSVNLYTTSENQQTKELMAKFYSDT